MVTYTFVVLVLLNLSLSHAELGGDYENYVQQEYDNDCEIVREMQKKFSELEQSVNSKINVLQNMDQNIIKAVKENQYLGCKEHHARGGYASYFNFDANSHIVYRKDSLNGGLYVEMHLAIKGNTVNILIAPSEEAKSEGHTDYIELGIYTENINWFKMEKQIGAIGMPNMMNPDRFTPVYIRITNDKLEFGKEGGPPLMTYTDPALKPAARFGFASVAKDKIATVLYDCPAIVF